MKSGIELIAQEREEQIHKHGRTIGHDVLQNKHGQLVKGAECLLAGTTLRPMGWNEQIYEKMRKKAYKDRLIIAGALIAAEIDRLQALEERQG